MKEDISIRITGEAGQGIVSSGMMLCRMYKDSGRHVFAIQDYMSRIRGGNNFIQVRAAVKPVAAPSRLADIILALDKEAAQANRDALAPGGMLLLDAGRAGITELGPGWVDAPIYALAQEAGGALYANSVALGIIAALTCGNFEDAAAAAAREFSNKGQEAAAKNAKAARLGYDHASGKIMTSAFRLAAGAHDRRLLLAGNEALALGAVSAGCKFFSDL